MDIDDTLWYQMLGFYNNPFSIKPAAYHNEILGHNGSVDEVLDKIRAGSVLFLDGEYGNGKTTMLRKMINECGGKKKVVYYSCNRSEDGLDVGRLADGGRGALGRVCGSWSDNLQLTRSNSLIRSGRFLRITSQPSV